MCWLEFKAVNGNKVNPVSIRDYDIASVVYTGKDSCIINLDVDSSSCAQPSYYTIAEPYEEVMKKIKETEESVDLSNCAVEHFTKEEYSLIRSMIPLATSEVHIERADSKTIKQLESINNKLAEILEENE